MLQKWLVKEMINIKYHILLSFATKAKLIGMFDMFDMFGMLMNSVKEKKRVF